MVEYLLKEFFKIWFCFVFVWDKYFLGGGNDFWSSSLKYDEILKDFYLNNNVYLK